MRSVRTAYFKRRLASLPDAIQRQAESSYQLFKQNPNHPSFRRRIIQSTRDWGKPHWEFRITRAYRATCFIDDDTYVWVFIGHHDDFERFYS